MIAVSWRRSERLRPDEATASGFRTRFRELPDHVRV